VNAIEPVTPTNEINQLSADVQSSLKIKIDDTTTTTTNVSDNSTMSTNHSNSPLIKNENYGFHNNNWTHQRYPRRGGNNNYRGNRRGGGGSNDNNRHYNNHQNYQYNNNNHDNEGGFNGRNNRNYHEKPGGGRAGTPSNAHSISTASLSNHSLSPIVSSSDTTASSEFNQVPYQPLYVQPYYSPYYAAPETAGDVNQPAQYIQYMQPQQPPHYNAIAPGKCFFSTFYSSHPYFLCKFLNLSIRNATGHRLHSTNNDR
jgi:hypothetical protein